MMHVAFVEAQRRVLDRYEVVAESRFVDVAVVAGRAHVLVAGSGPTVLMLNGIGTPAAMLAPLMAQLGSFTVAAVDLPGFGLTDTTPDFTDDYRRNAVRFLTEVLDGLGIPQAMIVANSLGSLWSTWMALDSPGKVERMAHVGCPALMLGTSAPLPMRMLSSRLMAEAMMRLQPPSVRQVEQLSKMVHEYPLSDEIADLLLATERLPGFEHMFRSSLHTLLRLRGSRVAVRITTDHLARVTQPVLMVWGDDDPMGSPSIGAKAAQILPDAELHVVPGGHAPWLTSPEQIGPLVCSFLAPRSRIEAD